MRERSRSLGLLVFALALACSRSEEPFSGVPAEPAAPIAHGVAVQVVDAASREPLSGASVTMVDAETLRAQGSRALERDWRGALAVAGRTWKTDREGRATLPYTRAPQMLFASGPGSRWGRARLVAGAAEPVVVAIARSRALVVDVVDPGRKPVAGATVRLEGREAGFIVDVWRVLTGADGRATIAPIDLHVAPDGERRLAVSLPNGGGEKVMVDLDALPERPVRLVAPGSGAVEVQLRTISNELLEIEAVGVVLESGSRRRNGAYDFRPVRLDVGGDQRAMVAFARGAARLTGLPLHASYWMEVFQGEQKITQAKFDGPTIAGETRSVVVQVERPPRVGSITGRMVTVDGPIARRSFAVILEGGPRSAHERRRLRSLTTDRDGCFELPFSAIVWPEPSTLHLYSFADDGRLELEGSFEAPLADEPSDLRDVHCGPAPFLAGGKAVDERGEPVVGAIATVRVAVDGVASAQFDGTRGLELVFLPELSAATGADGRFRLFGRVPEGMCAVQLSEGRHSDSPWMEFTPGMATLLQVLPRRGGLAGRVLLPPDVPQSAIVVQVEHPYENASRPDESVRCSLAADGSFEPRDLRLGPAKLTVSIGEVAGLTQLVEIGDVEVTAGSTNRDPRLAAIDLRDEIRVLRIEFVDESGAPLSRVRVTECEPGDDHRTWTSEAAREGLTLVASRPLPELFAHAEGRRIERFTPSGPSTRVVLRAGFPLRFELDPATPLPDASFALGIELKRDDGHASEHGHESPEVQPVGGRVEHRLDADHPVTWIASAPGPHTLTLTLLQCDPNTGEWFGLASRERTLDVEPRPDERTHSLRLDPWFEEEILDLLRARAEAEGSEDE